MNIGRGEQFTPEFQKLSPNARMPAILDPEGPDGQPISVFESGAILQYLARKTGNRFYGDDERTRVEVDQWLFWQMAGLGPMAGQANHFRSYAPAMTPDQRHLAYGVNRYTNELHRLYGVLDSRLRTATTSPATIRSPTWPAGPGPATPAARGIDLAEFPKVKAWVERIGRAPGRAARPGGGRGGSPRRGLARRQHGRRPRRSGASCSASAPGAEIACCQGFSNRVTALR